MKSVEERARRYGHVAWDNDATPGASSGIIRTCLHTHANVYRLFAWALGISFVSLSLWAPG
jgi:hypothetical protein